MGDENSLQGRTQAHKHEASSSTGGFLETGLTGMTNLSNGSLIMGNATEIQTELNSGNLNDVLTMGAVQPGWVAPAGGQSYELISSTTLGGASNDITLSFGAVSGSSVSEFIFTFNGGLTTAGHELAVRVNSDSSANYFMQRLDMFGGAGGFSQWSNETHWKPVSAVVTNGTSGRVFGKMNLQVDQTGQAPNILMTSTFVGSSGMSFYSGYVDITATSLSEIEIYALNGGSPTIISGSTASIFKVNL